jgi:Asp-tRNA(Asn)/Glu-tRNA(Gln) amidotransferase A subunit family amidase
MRRAENETISAEPAEWRTVRYGDRQPSCLPRPDHLTARRSGKPSIRVQVLTDTGFVSTDYSTWGSFPLVAFFFFYFIGGCTGSTSGSIKILRERHYDPRVAVRIRRGLEQTAVDYIELIHARAALIREVDAATRDFDLLLMPTVPFVAPRFAELADDAEYGRINMLALRNPSVWNFLDRPAISLPCAGGGLPVGAMLVGRRGHDRRLLAISLGAESVLAA